MTAEDIRVSSDWLALREPADAAARARDLVERLTRHPPTADRWVIHDLACGTGSMGRWLAPRLPGSQHWVLHDRDTDLLEIAAANSPDQAADGAVITVETRRTDITRLQREDLADATLITASALLDMLTGDELAGLIAVCGAVGCPLLWTMSVVGHVELTPAEPMDGRMAAAFNDHQRRMTAVGRLLGPDAVAAATEGFRRLGAEVVVQPSPWLLGARETELASEWLTGWVGAAFEQRPELAADADDYAGRRLAQAAAGDLVVIVNHADLLIQPRQPASASGAAQ